MDESAQYTIKGRAESLYKEKGSKFIGYAYPASDEEEIKVVLDELRKEYYDARHHCFAYIIAGEPERYRAFDDGEPRHSAGDPILGQIRSKNLVNVLVVVIRYFGGTKLGVSGLINAYKTAAAAALDAAEVKALIVTKELWIKFPYDITSDVQQVIHHHNLEIIKQDFKADCEFVVSVLPEHQEEVFTKFKQIQFLDVKLI